MIVLWLLMLLFCSNILNSVFVLNNLNFNLFISKFSLFKISHLLGNIVTAENN